jgi:hypothetical protein
VAETRNHHYVPQGYLRGFAKHPPAYPRKAKFLAFDLVQGKSFLTSVRNVAAIRDFNRIEGEGHSPNVLENAYGEFEGQATAAIKNVAKAGTFEGDDRILVLNLIALMATRNPRLRKNWSDFMDRVSRAMTRQSFATKDRYDSLRKRMDAALPPERRVPHLPYEEMKEFVDSGNYRFETHQNTHIRLELDVFESVLKTLISRKWVLQIADEKSGHFITSDHPVVVTSTKPSAPWMGAGHGLLETVLLFPLTRKCALVGTFEGEDGVIRAPPELVAMVNSAVIARATAQVYAYDETFQYTKGNRIFAGKNLHLDPDSRRMTIEEEGDDPEG